MTERQHVPDRDAIAALPEFPRLGLESIRLVASADAARAAEAELQGACVLGFDTESRPTFARGEASDGPHVAQFATATTAWVFQLRDPECLRVAAALLESPAVRKVGFGLSGDLRQLRGRLGVEPQAVLDLDTVFRERGWRKEVGVKAAIAILFGQRLVKSKKVATTNWANARLTESQIVYAANDAYAAMRVFEALERPAQR
ncbi:3'-5' exonuclease [Xylophilus sp. ASV27]|uniref:3'-5' exonuclease n=1 Tax=Xylophilus sp. ASV27 TaxID=2795129 RepID=UPI0018ED6FEC|nr:3'-5' exonuclease [Xylophilus sp. ASV27]